MIFSRGKVFAIKANIKLTSWQKTSFLDNSNLKMSIYIAEIYINKVC